jgi:hypothetical protein
LEASQEEAAAEAGPAKAGPTQAKAGLNTGYSRSARVNYVLAMKPPMSSISSVTKLPLARGCLYIWVPLPLPRIDMNWDKNWHDASPLMGTLLDLPSRNQPLCLGSVLFGNSTLIWISCIQECVILSNWLVSSPLGILSLASQSLTRNSTLWVSSCDSIELVNWANEDNRCVSCVCVFAFDLCVEFIMFFVFILLPRHKSRKSVKIGPHPRGQPLSKPIHPGFSFQLKFLICSQNNFD